MTAATTPGTYAAALLAIASHIHEHQLTPPREIERVWHPSGALVLRLNLDPRQHEPWINSVHVDQVHNTYQAPGRGDAGPYLRTVWEVRLPDTGTRLQIRALRELPFLRTIQQPGTEVSA